MRLHDWQQSDTDWIERRGYLSIVAATSFKRRVGNIIEYYYYADLLQYAVARTSNRVEYNQGVFVKRGDGAANFKPIAHLYKSQVYQLADNRRVPLEIRLRLPATDTHPVRQSEEGFFFMLPLEEMDLCLYGKNSGIPVPDLSASIGLYPEQVQKVYKAIHATRKVAQHLRAAPVLVEEVSEVSVP